jgi:hypothetical protein
VTTPSPGWRGSPAPVLQRDASSLGSFGVASTGTHARLHVKPPLVERMTKIPPLSSVRLNAISEKYTTPSRSYATTGSPALSKLSWSGCDGTGSRPS